MSCSTKVRGIEVELTSLPGTPVAIRSLSRNEVTNSFQETSIWKRVLRLMYITQTVHQMHEINSTLSHRYGCISLHV